MFKFLEKADLGGVEVWIVYFVEGVDDGFYGEFLFL